MATKKMLGGMGSGYLTPDPYQKIDASGKAMDARMDVPAESGCQTPRSVGEVNVQAVQRKLESLLNEKAQILKYFRMGPPPGLWNNSLDTEAMRVTMSKNVQPPYPAFDAAPRQPAPQPELLPYPVFSTATPLPVPLQFVRNDEIPAPQTRPMKRKTESKQVVSKGSVGHPKMCAPPCKYVKRKGGCRDAEQCPNCHHCFWSKAHASKGEEESLAPSQVGADAKSEEVKILANKLVSLIGGEKPFSVKAQEPIKPDTSVGTMGHQHTYGAPIFSTHPKSGGAHSFPTPQGEPKQQPWRASVGSMGHPYSCKPACKYSMKAKGCKDGDLAVSLRSTKRRD